MARARWSCAIRGVRIYTGEGIEVQALQGLDLLVVGASLRQPESGPKVKLSFVAA